VEFCFLTVSLFVWPMGTFIDLILLIDSVSVVTEDNYVEAEQFLQRFSSAKQREMMSIQGFFDFPRIKSNNILAVLFDPKQRTIQVRHIGRSDSKTHQLTNLMIYDMTWESFRSIMLCSIVSRSVACNGSNSKANSKNPCESFS